MPTIDPAKVKKISTTLDSKPVDLENTRKVADLLKAAKNPVVIGGSGIWYADAEKEFIEFVEKIGIPAFTAGAGRGVIPDTHPLCFESSLAIRPGCCHAGSDELRPGAFPGRQSQPVLYLRRNISTDREIHSGRYSTR